MSKLWVSVPRPTFMFPDLPRSTPTLLPLSATATRKVPNIHSVCFFSLLLCTFLQYPSSTSQPGKLIFHNWTQFKFTITMKIFPDLSRYTYSTPPSGSPASTHAACRLIYFASTRLWSLCKQDIYLCIHPSNYPPITCLKFIISQNLVQGLAQKRCSMNVL